MKLQIYVVNMKETRIEQLIERNITAEGFNKRNLCNIAQKEGLGDLDPYKMEYSHRGKYFDIITLVKENKNFIFMLHK